MVAGESRCSCLGRNQAGKLLEDFSSIVRSLLKMANPDILQVEIVLDAVDLRFC